MATDNKENLREIILTNELGNRMLDMVAPIYDRSALTLYVFQAFGIVLSKETYFIENEFIAQIFPQTATWGLKYWEEEYGITTDESKSIEERREILIISMYRKRPVTPYRIKQLVKSITGCESVVEENIQPNTMKIIVVGYVPGTLTALRNELDRTLPSHISYVLQMSEIYDMETSTYTGGGVSLLETYNMEEV